MLLVLKLDKCQLHKLCFSLFAPYKAHLRWYYELICGGCVRQIFIMFVLRCAAHVPDSKVDTPFFFQASKTETEKNHFPTCIAIDVQINLPSPCQNDNPYWVVFGLQEMQNATKKMYGHSERHQMNISISRDFLRFGRIWMASCKSFE